MSIDSHTYAKQIRLQQMLVANNGNIRDTINEFGIDEYIKYLIEVGAFEGMYQRIRLPNTFRATLLVPMN